MTEIKRKNDWLDILYNDLKVLAYEGIVKTKHAMGKRILQDELKFGKSEYGSHKIEELAERMQIGKTDIYDCINFAKQYPEFSDISENWSWYYITHKLLPNKPDWYQSSESPEWPTPQWLFDLLNKEFHFTVDVCATKENAKCKKFYTKEQNGLSKKWNGVCWMNPPYGREIADWMAKAKKSAEKGAIVVCLVPARPDTDWWWENTLQGEIRFIRGRLKWPGSNTIAPFPSAVIILSNQIESKVVWWIRAKEEKLETNHEDNK